MITYAPGVYQWRSSETQADFTQALARLMLDRFVFYHSNDQRVVKDIAENRTTARNRGLADSLVRMAYYGTPSVTHDWIREIEYPIRWRDAAPPELIDNEELRLAFEAMLDTGHYAEAYKIVRGAPRRGRR